MLLVNVEICLSLFLRTVLVMKYSYVELAIVVKEKDIKIITIFC